MSPTQLKPIIHGRDHAPGGADPIPNWPSCCDTSTGGAPNYETGVLSISGLRGYWRLGEGDFPYLDTSGYAPSDPANMILVTSAGRIAMTRDFTPGALGVDDDGAVQFNFDGNSSMGVGGDLMHSVSSGTPYRFDFAPALPFTAACWIRPLASAHTYQGTIMGTLAIGSGADQGWRFHIDQPGRVVGFCRAPNVTTGIYPTVQTPAGLAADTWHYIVGTYDGTTLRLYVNGTLVDSLADPSTLIATTNPVYIGEGPLPMAAGGQYFYGAVDEAAVWAATLTADEIAMLYVSGVTGASEAEGKVLTSDGDGGSSYQWPTVDVDGTRYEEILTGTNLDSTDNGNGTVTIDASGSSTTIATDTIWDAKGDVVAASGADAAARLAVGTNGQVLTADSAQTLGVKWATPTAGGVTPSDTAGWMPLTTVLGGTPDLVWDANDSLIPTYTAF